MVIRPAQAADLSAVFDLYRELEGVYGPEESGEVAARDILWEKVAADTRQQVLVAEEAGRVVGTLTVVIVPNLGHRGRPWAAVENVVVASAARGRGVGRALMERAADMARANGCYKLTLTSNEKRPEAHRFYENLGWRRTHAGFSVELQAKERMVRMAKVMVIISTAEKEKAATGLMYAGNAIKYNWLEDVKVFLFGPAEKLLAGDRDLQEMMAPIVKHQAPVACKFISDREDISPALAALGYKVDYVGSVISALIAEGYVPMVF